MGQKINPNGFRLGITTDHKTRWYADKNYAELVAEDVKIRELLHEDPRARRHQLGRDRASQRARHDLPVRRASGHRHRP